MAVARTLEGAKPRASRTGNAVNRVEKFISRKFEIEYLVLVFCVGIDFPTPLVMVVSLKTRQPDFRKTQLVNKYRVS